MDKIQPQKRQKKTGTFTGIQTPIVQEQHPVSLMENFCFN